MFLARSVRLTLAVLAAALIVPGVARGNGDPASDVLSYTDVFFVSGSADPATANLPDDRAKQLTKVVKDAKGSGFPIKVAVIGAPADLGLVPQFWQQPQRYADFLGQELVSFYGYRNRLLVVMPNGYGIYLKGGSSNTDKRILADLPAPASRPDLLSATSVAVLRLAAEDGIQLTLSPLADPTESSRNRALIWIGAGALALLALVALVFGRRRLRKDAPDG
jgi:MYXO-CTERM domain-containing protein